jgi:hypothetical protein
VARARPAGESDLAAETGCGFIDPPVDPDAPRSVRELLFAIQSKGITNLLATARSVDDPAATYPSA